MGRTVLDTNLQFIREKIYRLHTAIMYSMSNELIKIPNNIITVLRVDEDGTIWFQCKAPVQHIAQYEQSFPARLHFFRKGVHYFIEVSGSATIVNRDSVEEERRKDQPLLIKMNIFSVEYVEPHSRKKTWLDHAVEKWYGWMIRTLALPRTTKPVLAKLQQTSR